MFGTFYLPAFPAIAALRPFADLRAAPCAIVPHQDDLHSAKAKAPILAVNPAAAAWGMVPGWTTARALACCPELRILPQDPQREQLLAAELLELAESFTPDFEQVRPNTLLLDLSGQRHSHLPSAASLPGLRFCRAATPELSLLAAFATDHPTGDYQAPANFDPLPLELLLHAPLPGTAALFPILQTWGIRTLGELRQLPQRDLAERLGPHALHLQQILNGFSRWTLRLHRPCSTFVRNVCFESPIESWDTLLFEAKRMLDGLCDQLQTNHLATKEVIVLFLFESAPPLERVMALPEPLSAASQLMSPLQAACEALKLTAPVVGLELELKPVRPLASQRGWLGPQLRQPHRWAETLLRLEALLGPQGIGIPALENSHRPDAFGIQPAPTSLESPSSKATAKGGSENPDWSSLALPGSPIPLRRFRPPVKVNVATEPGSARPRPLALLGGPHPGAITRCRGPFPLSGNWWSQSPWQQIEWDVQLDEGHLLRLAHRPPAEWRIEGQYR